MTLINKESPNSLALDLSERIRHRIQSAEFTDGDFFLTEAELAEEYNVSRRIAREAVNRLCALGLLEGRKRKGLIVRHPDPVEVWANCLPSLARSPEKLADLAHFRYALEVGAIELAIINASEEQITQLAALAEEFQQTAGTPEDRPRRIEVERQFHGLILEMSGSPIIADMQKLLATLFENSYPARETPVLAEETNQRIIWQHFELVDAIKDRDVERARSVLRSHLKYLLLTPPETT
ncbi:FadR family transcriptional regulator [Gimesia benthica]|uniref:FadR family transcriptional regulator n=1 Tax=Gimesia benthica TaxID=2608982 RepID=A0A6I6A8G9_9PLAN|nr:FCD domain-containing protein [Gimesia benthica]QGQ22473.1 FadR family transcriptional regulator [Gimesia benthica]